MQRKEGDKIIDIYKPGAMTTKIQQVTNKWFGLANSVPANSLSLRNTVRFCALTTFAMDLLKGNVLIPRDTNSATTFLIWEMQLLWVKLQPLHGQTELTPEIYQYYWGKVNKRTSSALSTIHFGLWKAVQQSPKLTKLACSHINLIARKGVPPMRWGNSLQVLLEKIPGVALVDKLRAILLMEGDFNFFNKWFFWTRRSEQAIQYRLCPGGPI
jgi:hypothetical protein